MSLVVNTNVAALNAYRNLSTNQANAQDAMAKLSSGLKINKAADDAAGLSISQGLTSQINGMTVAATNVQQGTNVAQIADGALGTSQQVLQRMRDLTVQAANSGANGTASIASISGELTSLSSNLDKIASGTKYNGKNLLDGSYTGDFQIGANSGTSDQINLSLNNGGVVGFGATGLGILAADIAVSTGAAGIGSASGAQALLTKLDTAIGAVSTARSTVGSFQNTLSYTAQNLQTSIVNQSASRSTITDADLAVEVGKMSQSNILAQAATSVLSQANSAPQAVLKLLQ